MEISAGLVKSLREKSGAGVMDCKDALKNSGGNIDDALSYLRKKGISSAAKKMDRSTSEGAVISYIHPGNKIGVLLEVNCETDFVARNEVFLELCKDLCMHIAASSPEYVSPDQVPEEAVQKEKEILEAQAKESGKPDDVIEKIVAGRLNKFYDEICLLKQSYVKDPDGTIEALIQSKISELGEKIVVSRFSRYQLGNS